MIKAFRESVEAEGQLFGDVQGLFHHSNHLLRTVTTIAKTNEARNVARHLALVKAPRPPTPHLIPLPPTFVESVERNAVLPSKDVSVIKTKAKRQQDWIRTHTRTARKVTVNVPKASGGPLQDVLQTAYMSWLNMRIMNKEHSRRLHDLSNKSDFRVRLIKHGGLCEGDLFEPEEEGGGGYLMPQTLATRVEKQQSTIRPGSPPSMMASGIPDNTSLTMSPRTPRLMSIIPASGVPVSESVVRSDRLETTFELSGRASRKRSICFADALKLAGFGGPSSSPPGSPGGAGGGGLGGPGGLGSAGSTLTGGTATGSESMVLAASPLTRRESVMMASGIFNVVRTIPKPPETIAAPLLFRRQHKVKGLPAKRSPTKAEDPSKPPMQHAGVPLTSHQKFRIEYADGKLDFDALSLQELNRSDDIRRRCFDQKATAFAQFLNDRKFINAPWNVAVKKINAQVALTLGKEFTADQTRQRERWLTQIHDFVMNKYSLYPECEAICHALRKLCYQEDFVFGEPQFVQLLTCLPEHKLLMSHIVAIFDLLRPVFDISAERMKTLLNNRLKALEQRDAKLGELAGALVDNAELVPSSSLASQGSSQILASSPTTYVVKIIDLRVFSDAKDIDVIDETARGKGFSCDCLHVCGRCDDTEKVTTTKSNHAYHPTWNEELTFVSKEADNILFLTVIGGPGKGTSCHVLAAGYVILESYVPYGEWKPFTLHLKGVFAMKLSLSVREERKVSMVPRPPRSLPPPGGISSSSGAGLLTKTGSFRGRHFGGGLASHPSQSRAPGTTKGGSVADLLARIPSMGSEAFSLSRSLDPDTCPSIVTDEIVGLSDSHRDHSVVPL